MSIDASVSKPIRRVGMISLGCPKNLVDSEIMLGQLREEAEVEITNDLEAADVVIVNTCGFIDAAKQESIDTILEVAERKGKGLQRLVVTGCMVMKYRADLQQAIPEIDAFVGLDSPEAITGAVTGVIDDAAPARRKMSVRLYEDLPRVLAQGNAHAYLKVSEGCSNPCTFCAIPQMRGKFRSRGIDSLVREAQSLEAQGVKELCLVAQDTTRYGEDLGILRAKSDEILSLVKSVPGVVDAHRDISSDVPQAQVTVNLAKAQKYGLKPGDVRRDAATLVAGEEVGDIFRAGKAYDVVVWSPDRVRHSFSDIENLPIDLPNGGHIRLGEVATVALRPNPNAIDRQGDSRYLDVGASVAAGHDLGSVVNDIKAKLASVKLARGYHVEMLGEYQERQAAQSRLLESAVIAAALTLFLLQAAFRRWRLALLAFLTLPMALVGGVLAAWIGGGIISLGSLVGFFTVFGIAARNGILLINHFQHLEEEEGMEFGRELVLRGARERLAPILMTSLATGLALVPLVALGLRPGHEIEHPLAVVILGGLVTSTLLNLFVVPSLYLRFGHRGRRAAPRPRPETGVGP